MSSWGEFLLWLAFIFPLVFSAGPGNVLCAVCGAANGFAKSIPFILGLDIVYFSYALLAGYGFAAIITAYPVVFLYFQVAGAAYIFWLGIKFLRQSQRPPSSAAAPRLRFVDGVISQALNIKGVTIVLAMFSQFLNADAPLHYEVLTLSGALLLLNLFTHATWSYGGAWMARHFTSPRALRLQNTVFGALLLLIAAWLLYRSVSASAGG